MFLAVKHPFQHTVLSYGSIAADESHCLLNALTCQHSAAAGPVEQSGNSGLSVDCLNDTRGNVRKMVIQLLTSGRTRNLGEHGRAPY